MNYAYSGSNVTVTDEKLEDSLLTYVAFGNPDDKYLFTVTDQDQNTTTYSRNILGNVTGITQGSITRAFSYNDPAYINRKFLMSETSPETGTITYTRDNVGNMKSKTDVSGKKTYTYDDIDRLTQITSGASTIKYVYDKADNRKSMTYPGGSATYTFDAVNRMTQKAETISTKTYTTTYVYNNNDNIKYMIYPSSRTVEFGFNDNNQVTSIPDFVTNVSYSTTGTSAGLPHSFTLANGILTNLSYNDRQSLTGIEAGSALKVGYGYDSRGNTKTITDNLDGSKSQSFTYDSLSRLQGFNGAWGNGSFEYNALGNRKTKTVSGGQTTYVYTSNRLTSTTGAEPATYNYYGNGALSGGIWGGGTVFTLSYDVFDNLAIAQQTGSGVTATYIYDGDGMRVKKNVGGKTFVYHYDLGGRVISEDNGSGTLLADYVYLNGKLAAKMDINATLPPAPTGLTATAISNSKINLAWTDNSGDETGFAIERKTGATGVFARIATVGAGISTFSDKGLTTSTKYYYQVRAYRGGIYSAYSNAANAKTLAKPAAPSDLVVSDCRRCFIPEIGLSWKDNSDSETGFSIESGSAFSFAKIATVGANVTGHTFNTVTSEGLGLCFRVRAFQGTNYSDYSKYQLSSGYPAVVRI